MDTTAKLSEEERYNLMDASDIIKEGMQINWPSAVYIAFNTTNQIISAGRYQDYLPNSAYIKAVSRGCTCPIICTAQRSLTKEQIETHNNLLEKSLLERKSKN